MLARLGVVALSAMLSCIFQPGCFLSTSSDADSTDMTNREASISPDQPGDSRYKQDTASARRIYSRDGAPFANCVCICASRSWRSFCKSKAICFSTPRPLIASARSPRWLQQCVDNRRGWTASGEMPVLSRSHAGVYSGFRLALL